MTQREGHDEERTGDGGGLDAEAEVGAGAEPGAGLGDELGDEERAQRRAALEALVAVMAPAVEADGGELVLVDADVTAGVVHIELRGACSSCAMSAVTLRAGVERLLHQRLEWVREVVAGVAEADDWDASVASGTGGWQPAARPVG